MHSSVFTNRRQRLIDRLGPGVALIVASAPVIKRNSDVEYPYRQESHFWYATGIEEPNCLAVLKSADRIPYRLYRPDRNLFQERWTGARFDHDHIKRLHCIGSVCSLNKFADDLPTLLNGVTILYWKMGVHLRLDTMIRRQILDSRSRAGMTKKKIELRDPATLLAPIRLIKSPEEIALLKRAARITAEGFKRAAKTIRPGLYEYQLKAEIEYALRYNGSVRNGYDSIVAGGAGTCVLHNLTDRNKLKSGDLVLIDAGAEWEYYSADVTRTYPVSGQFTSAQRLIYDIVLSTQEIAIKHVKPGITWNELEAIARKHMDALLIKHNVVPLSSRTRPLRQLADGGLDSLRQLADRAGMTKWLCDQIFVHRLGHWLGLDVHDVGDHTTPFAPGMALTIEPGIYIPAGTKNISKRFWNIGVRIEDDVIVTKTGNEILTTMIQK